jgi:hypothetical protein
MKIFGGTFCYQMHDLIKQTMVSQWMRGNREEVWMCVCCVLWHGCCTFETAAERAAFPNSCCANFSCISITFVNSVRPSAIMTGQQDLLSHHVSTTSSTLYWLQLACTAMHSFHNWVTFFKWNQSRVSVVWKIALFFVALVILRAMCFVIFINFSDMRREYRSQETESKYINSS